MQYTARFYSEKEGGFSVEFPDVPGALTCGETIEECKKYAAEALELVLEEVLIDNMELPVAKAKPDESKGMYSIAVDPRLATAIAIHEAKKGLKASVVAKRMGMSPQSFARLTKPTSNVSVTMLDRFAKAVGKRLEVNLV